MLKLPNLDDRMYEQMVEDARKQIPALYPNWTDENAHDPGITMLELFSWLIEMQQYYLDRITDKNELKFLKLLGVKPREAGVASTEIHFTNVLEQTVLPKGTKLLAGEHIFETGEPLLLVPAVPDKMLVRTEAGTFDYTSSNEGRNIAFPAFGTKASAGSSLLIGFSEPLPHGKLLTLSVLLYDQYPIQAVKDALRERIPSARLEWLVFAGEPGGEQVPDWKPLKLVRDETNELSQSGRLLFRMDEPMQPRVVHPATDRQRYWLCCRVVEAGYELPPKIDQIAVNAVTAHHMNTWSEAELFDWEGDPKQALHSGHYLSYFGHVRVQVRTRLDGWQEWRETADLSHCGPEENVYELHRDEAEKTVTVRFGDGVHGRLPAAGRSRVRIISCAPAFEPFRVIGTASGLYGQRIEHLDTPIIASGIELQIGQKDPSTGEWTWHDWKRVDDFDSSSPEDRHFTLDPQAGTIRFGDNEKGRAPEKSDEPNIVLTAFQTGGGSAGNVNVGLIRNFAEPWPQAASVRPVNLSVAEGGRDPETLEQAKRRARMELKQPATAVTAEDVERVVLQTPGLRVARAKAIPLYYPGLRHYPKEKAPGRLSVVVVPYSQQARPLPSAGFRETVKRHLDKHRLLSTEIDIIPPEYIQITIHAVIAAETHFKDEKEAVCRALNRLLQPFDSGDGSPGWTFGRTVYRGDIYGAINRIKGVSYIQELWISAEGRGYRKEAGGDITLPPNGLVCSGEHDIEMISLSEL